MRLTGRKRQLAALGILICMAALAWATMDTGKVRAVVLVLLGSFALRILLLGREE